jgi:hypothetical protein
MAWQTFDNNLSVKFETSPSRILTSMNASHFENSDFLFPFKVVTLGWLISTGKYKFFAPNFAPTSDPVQFYFCDEYKNKLQNQYFYQSAFDGSEKYLPVGDMILDKNSDPDKIPVLLIYNDELYCKKIIDFSYIDKAADFAIDNNYTHQYLGLLTPTTIQGYTQLGDKCGQLGLDFIVVVNSDYVYSTKNTNAPFSSCNKTTGGFGAFLDFTSMFSTFFVTSSATLTPVKDIPRFFYDIVPGQLLGDCCDNTIAPELPQEICNNYTAKTNSCQQYMNNFCTKDNLQSEACYNFCTNPDNMCDDALKAYCGDDQSYKKLNPVTYNKTCSCFLSDDYYKKWQENIFNNLSPQERSYLEDVLPPFVSNCSYPACAAGDGIQLHNSKCVPSNIQVCIDNNTINVDGSVSDSVINVNSLINCVQNVGPTSGPGKPTKPGGGGSPSTKLIIPVVVISFIIILILIAVAIYFLYRK